jgi:hypothetical protein
MSRAVPLLLCCCDEQPTCGDCDAEYLLQWTGSIEFLALCCPVLYCPDANEEAGESSTLCDPCEWIIDAGGNPCRGDCGADGCYLLKMNGSVGPLNFQMTAGNPYPPCIYTGQQTVEIEIRHCCDEIPDGMSACNVGLYETIAVQLTVTMSRGGFGYPTDDWVAQVMISVPGHQNNPGCAFQPFANFRAFGSGDKCPNEVTFTLIDAYDFVPSMLDPCNVMGLSSCYNIHAADPGTVVVI